MNNSLEKIYERHHKNEREKGFSIMKKERGKLLEEIIGRNKSILDIGCRDGALTKYFAAGNKVLAVDIDKNALDIAREELEVKTLSFDLNDSWAELAGKKFDVVVAGEIIEHLYYPEEVVKKVIRHLNYGGLFLGSVPNAFSLKNRLRYLVGKKKNTPLEDPTHINQFSYKELEMLLNKYFKEVNIIGLGRFSMLARIMPNWFGFVLFFKVKI